MRKKSQSKGPLGDSHLKVPHQEEMTYTNSDQAQKQSKATKIGIATTEVCGVLWCIVRRAVYLRRAVSSRKMKVHITQFSFTAEAHVITAHNSQNRTSTSNIPYHQDEARHRYFRRPRRPCQLGNGLHLPRHPEGFQRSQSRHRR